MRSGFPQVPLLLALALAASCTGELKYTNPPPGVGDDDGDDDAVGGGIDAGGGGGAQRDNAAARAAWTADIAPMMVATRPKGTCASCHQGAGATTGPAFLGATPADSYATLVGQMRLIGTTAADSVFLTLGAHTGDAFCNGPGDPYAACTADEAAVVASWIDKVNAP